MLLHTYSLCNFILQSCKSNRHITVFSYLLAFLFLYTKLILLIAVNILLELPNLLFEVT